MGASAKTKLFTRAKEQFISFNIKDLAFPQYVKKNISHKSLKQNKFVCNNFN